MGFSVLMSVYEKEKPEYFLAALQSVIHQTLQPDEIVLMEDGQLTDELYQVIDTVKIEYPNLKSYPSKKNQGLGLSLKRGVSLCENELIARMDTDDIAKSNRFELQYCYMTEHAEVAALGGFMEEFSEEDKEYHKIKKMPLEMSEIRKYARYRNPLNHMTVMFRKSAVLEAGGYRHFPYLEDYDLWIRMLAKGACFHNLDTTLVMARCDNDIYGRRGGVSYCKQYLKLRRQQYDLKLLRFLEYQVAKLLTIAMTIQPKGLRKAVYRKVLRR